MKKKIFMFTLAACLIILSIAGSSLAYFTDIDDATTTFTAGNVAIELSVADLSTTKLFPGQEYDCPAVITNTGTEEAYVGAVITILGTDLNTVLVPESNREIPAAIKAIFNGLEADGYTVKYTTVDGGYKIYFVQDAILGIADGNKTATIFSKIAIPASWDHDQMNAFKTATVTVTAYATQTVGFNNAVEALTTAFENNGWENYPA